jgi:predicted SAM-dependent methyltransferase
MSSRAEALFGFIPPNSHILEIGPSYNPLFPKSQNYNVKVIDHASRADLIEKYKEHPSVDIKKIEEVDYVWSSGPLHQAAPGDLHGYFDIFVASHVIEHTTDLVAFLKSAEILLAQTGRVLLVVPDRRFCFDFFRPATTTGMVIDGHLAQRSRHSAGTIFDQVAYSASAGGRFAWDQTPLGPLRLEHSIEKTPELLSPGFADWDYVDAHAWRFTPSSFQLILFELAWLGLLDWKISKLGETRGSEFPAELVRGGTEAARSLPPATRDHMRLEFLKASLLEARAGIDWWLAGHSSTGLQATPEQLDTSRKPSP